MLNDKQQALFRAIIKNDNDEVCFLLKEGLDPNFETIDGWSPLHWSCLASDEIMLSLLKAKADPNFTAKTTSITPLHVIASMQSNCQQKIKYLLEYGAAKDTFNILKETPVDLALSHSNSEAIKVFLDKEIMPESIDKTYPSFSLLLKTYIDERIDSKILKMFLDSITLLLGKKAHLNIENENGVNKFYFTSKTDYLETAKLIVEYGKWINFALMAFEGIASNDEYLLILKPNDNNYLLNIFKLEIAYDAKLLHELLYDYSIKSEEISYFLQKVKFQGNDQENNIAKNYFLFRFLEQKLLDKEDMKNRFEEIFKDFEQLALDKPKERQEILDDLNKRFKVTSIGEINEVEA
ncbi:MAG TPA: hypothetical protein LFW21_03790 [Rickettsia endosymbiont of Pyrocoelia pectoralis]|nr:hypothetical protein [Rickettsia endosymbiont of Pyrocoelia pectoralis]